ncbi:ABC transporter ATP-binding protein [Thermobrachium celere]|uniref:ABC transporter ATP-binding protein n=1 Tax=Thermobrachium celere TaxID=53422 RepID=UPI001940E839|nr:ABC transporter ATP-binding protein [Thermobrachium celere]GFR35734.1 ABC transporter ATP-binding protein [Thermobrachium celere]
MSNIKIFNVYKYYNGRAVLKNINLDINEGELVVLLGPSGSGKTTLINGIAGIISFENGEVYFNKDLMNNVPIERRNAALVDQNLLLFPHMNVYSNIAFGLKMRRLDKEIIDKKVKLLIDLMELSGLEKKYPYQLSGGQAQRVAIARALAIEPKVLLLDEPLSKLDKNLRRNMQEFIKELQKKLNITTIMVTHDLEEAFIVADKIALLIDGEIKQYDTPANIYEKPVSKEVAEFFGCSNYIYGKVENGKFISDVGVFDVNVSNCQYVTYMFRPEQIILGEKQKNSLKARIIKRQYLGDRVNYIIDINGNKLVCSSNNKNLNIGDTVYISLDFDNAICFFE